MPRPTIVLLALFLLGCGTSYDLGQTGPAPSVYAPPPQVAAARRSPAAGVADYRRTAPRIEAAATAFCLEAHPDRPRAFCDIDFRLVDDPRLGPNAFQTLDRNGRPVVAMTVQLAAETQNADEIAFILGHEAAHHIADHIPKSRSQSMAGALVLGTLATLGNASEEAVGDLMELGASLGGRAYSQSYELEADVVGAFIAARAGYDPERGARVFTRPVLAGGGGLLSTHPASTRRQAAVAVTAAEIRRQQAAGLVPRPVQVRRGLP